jgi:hypothetical protein
MSQRARIVFAVVALTAVLFLAAPMASHAAGHRPGKAPGTSLWEGGWSWLSDLLLGSVASKPISGLEKDGSTSNSSGALSSGTANSVPVKAQSDQGSIIDPNGAK